MQLTLHGWHQALALGMKLMTVRAMMPLLQQPVLQGEAHSE